MLAISGQCLSFAIALENKKEINYDSLVKKHDMKRKIFITIAGGVFAFGIMLSPMTNTDQSESSISIENLKIMAKAFAEEVDCTKVPLTSAEYLECFNCVAVNVVSFCNASDGTTHSYAKPPEEPVGT